MNLGSAGFAKRLTAAVWLLWAALLFAPPSAQCEQPAPISAQEAQTWKQYGFSPEDAAEWKHVGFSPVEAREWVQAGIPYAQWADQWRGEGFGPGQAKEWVKKVNVYTAGDFRKFGFSSREALDWVGSGIRSGLRAKEFRDGGFTAAQAGPWWKREFFPEDARVWRDAGFGAEQAIEWRYGKKKTHYMRGSVKGFSRPVYSVDWARQWSSAGFTSAEAKQCLRFNMDFHEAVRWSKTGFKIEDAFQWKDSGFGPEEAQQRRAAGQAPLEAEEERDAALQHPGDQILSFHSDIVLHRDSTLTVTEMIEVQDRPGGTIQGCFKRIFPGRVTLWDSEDSTRTTAPSYKLLAVLKDGSPARYSTEKDSWGDQTICIGEQNRTLKDGISVFTIRYKTDLRVVELHDHDELSFDIMGPYFELPVKKASAMVHLPKGADLFFADGYAGPRERKYFTVAVQEDDGGDQAHYAVTRPLKAKMVFEVSVAFAKGAARPGLLQRIASVDRQMGHLFSGIGVFMAGLLIVFGYFISVWRRVGKDPEPGPAAPQYEPPEGISPAMMRYLITGGRLDENTVAATLVRLAQCGAIRIAKERNLYRINRTGEVPMACLPEERTFLDCISGRSGSLVVGVRHGNKTLRSVTDAMKEMLQQEYRKYVVTNSRYLWQMLVPSVVAAAVGVFFLDLSFDGRGPRLVMVYSGFAFVVLCVMLFVFYRLLKAPTPAGSKLTDRIEGFRKFLAVNYQQPRAARERPETDAPPFLKKHLPYAIALGIDSEYVSIRTKSLEWYAGRPGGFSPYDFTSSLRMRRPGAAKPLRPAKPRGAGAEL